MLIRLRGVSIIVAVAAFVLSGILGAVSLILSSFGYPHAQLAVAGIAEVLVTLVFLVAGLNLLVAVGSALRGRPFGWGDLVFVLLVMMVSVCWIIIGTKGLVSPRLLKVFFGHH